MSESATAVLDVADAPTAAPGTRRFGSRLHGYSYTSEYRAWQTMRLRCTVPENPAWPDYGGRGITVCDRWLNSVENFIADMGRKPSPKHELDREDNDRGYDPDNCRWVTRAVNDRNRRSNRRITLDGVTRTLAEWCEVRQLPRDTVWKRLAAGWSEGEALSAPVQRRGPVPKGDRVWKVAA